LRPGHSSSSIRASSYNHASTSRSVLEKVRGKFGFVIFDANARRVLVARDREGTQPLYWGATTDGRFMVRKKSAGSGTSNSVSSRSMFVVSRSTSWALDSHCRLGRTLLIWQNVTLVPLNFQLAPFLQVKVACTQ
jgi:asparagine synthetase B (glutamine-hydrolysing)